MNALNRLTGVVLIAIVSVFGQQLSFVKAPAFTGSGSSWTVSFEVSQETDVEISIVNMADSSVVRRLAAGVLGPNAPSPLTKGSLSQTLTWDGKDDLGSTVSSTGELYARVRAGMGVSLNNIVGENFYKFGSSGRSKVSGLALGDDGSVYVVGTHGTLAAITIRQFDGNGNYIKTVFPYPAGMQAASLIGYGINQWTDGTYNPKCSYMAYPNISTTIVTDPSSSIWPFVRNGELVVFSMADLDMVKLKTTSDIIGDGAEIPLIASPELPYWRWIGGPKYLCMAPDNQHVYVSGLFNWDYSNKAVSDTGFYIDGQVFKVNLETGIAKSFIKLNDVPLSGPERDNTIGPRYHSNNTSARTMAAIHGVAVDNDGNVFICDRLHQQLGIYDNTGAFIKAVPVENPDLVKVNKTTGELYVVSRSLTGYHTGHVSIRKFSDWRGSPAETATLIDFVTGVGEKFGSSYAEKVYMLVSQAVNPPVLWFTSYSSRDDQSQNSVWCIRDDGDRFTVIKDFSQLTKGVNDGFDRIAVDRRTETVFVQDSWDNIYKIVDWMNPALACCSTTAGKPLWGGDMYVSPDGFLYVREGEGHYNGPITRYTMTHKHAPANFPGKSSNVVTSQVGSRMGKGYADRGLSISPAGKVVAIEMPSFNSYRVVQYGAYGGGGSGVVSSLPGQNGGARYDGKGNIYIGGKIRASGHVIPSGFENDWAYDIGVGAVVKFGPSGGSFSGGGQRIYKPGLAVFSAGGGGCVCRSPRFDVDLYGRIFIPNALTSRVAVVDNEDNMIVEFGEYGNNESKGAGSPVPGPDIPLAWPVGAAASDDFIYITDMINCRLVQVRMNYALDNMPGLTGNTVDVDNQVADNGAMAINALPNPFFSRTTIIVKGNSKGKPKNIDLKIYNINGKMVKGLSSMYPLPCTFYLQAAGLSSGIYIARIKIANKLLTKKLFLNK